MAELTTELINKTIAEIKKSQEEIDRLWSDFFGHYGFDFKKDILILPPWLYEILPAPPGNVLPDKHLLCPKKWNLIKILTQQRKIHTIG